MKSEKRQLIFFTVFVFMMSFLVVGCAHNPSKEAKVVGVSTLEPRSGSDVRGTVTLNEHIEGAILTARIENATPGKHGFHIHEKGDCSAKDASSAGGHYDPTESKHGGPLSGKHHVGDLGNIVVGSDGTGVAKHIFKTAEFSDWSDVVGRSIVVHAGVDDLKSQPAGNAGKRVACGVITEPPAVKAD